MIRRFIQAYRWELTLLVVVPAFGNVISFLSANLLFFTMESKWIVWSSTLGSGLGLLGSAVLLGLCYRRVRRINQRYLTLLWTYSIVSDVVGALSTLATWTFAVIVTDTTDSVIQTAQTLFILSVAEIALHLPVLLVFARRASRFSLWHGFLLYLVFRSYAIPNFVSFLGLTDSQFAASLYWLPIGTVWFLAVGCSLAWLLGNFESRGNSFRQRATAVLLVAQLLLPFHWTVLPFHLTAMTVRGLSHAFGMALIYLVRVRRINMDEQFEQPPQTPGS